MAVVFNAKGTSVSSFQISKAGPKLTNSSGSLSITDSSDALQLSIVNTASAVNNLELSGSVASSPLTLSAAGTDADIGITISPKGTGVVQIFSSGSPTITGDVDSNFTISSGDASAANAGDLNLSGGAGTGTFNSSNIVITGGSTTGSGSGGSITLTPGTSTSGAAGTVNITSSLSIGTSSTNQLDISGNSTGLSTVVAASGTDANVGIDLSPKGTGIVNVNSQLTSTSLLASDPNDAVIEIKTTTSNNVDHRFWKYSISGETLLLDALKDDGTLDGNFYTFNHRTKAATFVSTITGGSLVASDPNSAVIDIKTTVLNTTDKRFWRFTLAGDQILLDARTDAAASTGRAVSFIHGDKSAVFNGSITVNSDQTASNLLLQGNTTGNPARITAAGTDANIDI